MNPIINRKQDILYKDLAVDLTAHRVSRAGHELLLTPREFALLAVLVTHCDTALSRSQLLEAAWGSALHFFTVQGAFLPFQKVPYSPPGV